MSIGAAWAGAQELRVRTDDAQVRALAYPELVGSPAVGDRVLLNVTALTRGLGTGGYALVVALPDALPQDPPVGPGHLVKARYTPQQAMVLSVDEQESPHHEQMREADDLGGLPVVVADLHSALPAIVAGIRWAAEQAGRAEPKVAYVMTDGGALPAWFSRTVAGLREAGWLEWCITVGQAFGGDLEAVTVHTGLLAARSVCEADVVVVAQGPGNLGSGTRWGFSGVAAGETLNAAGVLGRAPDRGAAGVRSRPASPAPGDLAPLTHRLWASCAGRGRRGRAGRRGGVGRSGRPARTGARSGPGAVRGVGPAPPRRDPGLNRSRDRPHRVPGATVDHGPRTRRRPGGLRSLSGGRRARGRVRELTLAGSDRAQVRGCSALVTLPRGPCRWVLRCRAPQRRQAWMDVTRIARAPRSYRASMTRFVSSRGTMARTAAPVAVVQRRDGRRLQAGRDRARPARRAPSGTS